MDIIVVDGTDAGRRLHVGPGARSIGRDAGNDLPLEDPAVSGRHAIVRAVDDRHVEITDLASTNGSWVGGRRIDGAAVVSVGETITIGTTQLVVETGLSTDDPDLLDDPVWADPTSAASTGLAPAAMPRVSDAGPVAGGDVSMAGGLVAGRDLVYHDGFRLRSRMRPEARRILHVGIGFTVGGVFVAFVAVIGMIVGLNRPGFDPFDDDGFSDDFELWTFLGLGAFGVGMLVAVIGVVMIVFSLLMRREKIPEAVPSPRAR